MHDHRCQRQPLGASLWTYFHYLVETSEESFQVIRNQLPVMAGEMVNPFVDGTQRAGAALLVEVAAEALRPACGAGADEFRQLSLFRLEFSRHRRTPLWIGGGPPPPPAALPLGSAPSP